MQAVCKLRHPLERHELSKRILPEINGYLNRHGLKIGTGTIVDATILHAPSSTKNKSGKRDPAMHPVRKGNSQCVFNPSAQPFPTVSQVNNAQRPAHSANTPANNTNAAVIQSFPNTSFVL